jgi:hypothetical protein
LLAVAKQKSLKNKKMKEAEDLQVALSEISSLFLTSDRKTRRSGVCGRTNSTRVVTQILSNLIRSRFIIQVQHR